MFSAVVLAFHSQTGLETLPYAFLVILTLALHARSTLDERDSVSWAWVWGIASLVRPEGVLLFPVLWLMAVLRRPVSAQRRARARRALRAFGVVFLPLLFFRILYFGQIWPNSVIAKSGTMGLYLGMPLARALRALVQGPGTEALMRFGREHLLMTLVITGCLMLKRTRWFASAIGLLVITYAAMITWNGGDWMPHDRLLTPCIAPLCVAAALGTRGFLFHREQRTSLGHLPSYVVACALFVVCTKTAWRPLAGAEIALTDKKNVREIGERLATLVLEHDLVASELAGVLPYYWQAPTVDMFGICDAHIARTGIPQQFGVGRTAAEYVVAKKPSFFVFACMETAAAFFAGPAFEPYRDEYYLLQYPYAYAKTFKAGAPPAILVRKDRPESSRLEQVLGAQLIDAGQELRRTGYVR
ncbi:MAG: hypothetical protein ACM3ZE_07005 [Myxococcales bacterium]